MASGRVKWFNKQKGFGFILQDGGADVFVHYRDIKGMEGFKKLYEGDLVQYDLVGSDKGPKATNVILEQRHPYDPRGISPSQPRV